MTHIDCMSLVDAASSRIMELAAVAEFDAASCGRWQESQSIAFVVGYDISPGAAAAFAYPVVAVIRVTGERPICCALVTLSFVTGCVPAGLFPARVIDEIAVVLAPPTWQPTQNIEPTVCPAPALDDTSSSYR